MGLGVVWLNGIVWALTQLVAEVTREEGCLEPAIHPHRWARFFVVFCQEFSRVGSLLAARVGPGVT